MDFWTTSLLVWWSNSWTFAQYILEGVWWSLQQETIKNEYHYTNKQVESVCNMMSKAKYCWVISASLSDIRHSEKKSFALWFVNEEKGKIWKECFLGFRTVNESTGQPFMELLLRTLKENNMTLKNSCGQDYDNVTNMKRQKKNVQVRLLIFKQRTSFVPCGCQVVSDAALLSKGSISFWCVTAHFWTIFCFCLMVADSEKNAPSLWVVLSGKLHQECEVYSISSKSKRRLCCSDGSSSVV